MSSVFLFLLVCLILSRAPACHIHTPVQFTRAKKIKDQKLRLRNSDARNEGIETGAVVTSRRRLSGIERGKGLCYQWIAKGQWSRGGQCSVRHEGHERARPTPKKRSTFRATKHQEVEARRDEGASEAEAGLGSSIVSRAKTS